MDQDNNCVYVFSKDALHAAGHTDTPINYNNKVGTGVLEFNNPCAVTALSDTSAFAGTGDMFLVYDADGVRRLRVTTVRPNNVSTATVTRCMMTSVLLPAARVGPVRYMTQLHSGYIFVVAKAMHVWEMHTGKLHRVCLRKEVEAGGARIKFKEPIVDCKRIADDQVRIIVADVVVKLTLEQTRKNSVVEVKKKRKAPQEAQPAARACSCNARASIGSSGSSAFSAPEPNKRARKADATGK